MTALRLPSLLLLALFALAAMPAYAQSEVSDDAVNEVARELFCPTCENTPLDVCPTQTCADWREEIRVQLADGRSPDEIREYFAARYGDHVLAEPPRRGFDLIAWLLPVIAVLGGGLLFTRYLLSIRRPKPLTGPAPPRDLPHADAYAERVERELGRDQ